MKSYEVYTSRRKALRLTQLDLSKLAGVTLLDVVKYEKGETVSYDVIDRIKNTIWQEQKNLDYADHVKVRILELGIQMRDEEDKKELLKNISHMMQELGRLQGVIMGYNHDTKRWE